MTKNEKKEMERAFQEQRSVLGRLEDVLRHKPSLNKDADFADAAAWGARVYGILFRHVGFDDALKALILERDASTFKALEVDDIIGETIEGGA